MINDLFFELMKNNFIAVLKKKNTSSIEIDDLSIDYNGQLNEQFLNQLNCLKVHTDLLQKASTEHDELAMQSALLKLRSHAMTLSSFFEAIAEDSEVLLKMNNWPEIPEGYQLPAHYGLPGK
ncbi:hypothetical protein PJ912_01575 [Pectobacterium colocasium]|uniref:hypothetical protein n=1 Tax=Pectobacterium TaxID=122277 RepID=UPI003018370D|nr:hypothetical protein KXZ65_01490 [Pectobacterium sp. PL152]